MNQILWNTLTQWDKVIFGLGYIFLVIGCLAVILALVLTLSK